QEPIIVKSPGRARYLGDGKRWRVEYDGMIATSLSRELGPRRWTAGFDGERFYRWDVNRNAVTLGDSLGEDMRWRPRELFWHRYESELRSLERPLASGGTITISQRMVEGTRCYVINRTVQEEGSRSEVVVAPKYGYMIVETLWIRRGKPYHIHSLREMKE